MEKNNFTETVQSANNKWEDLVRHLENELKEQMRDADNSLIYAAMAKNMRYVENNADNLLAALPNYGMAEEERKQLIDSALKQRQNRRTPDIVLKAQA